MAKGVGMLVTAPEDIQHSKGTAAKTEAENGLKVIEAGEIVGAEADKLLDLPTE